MTLALVLFALAAVGGVVLAAIRFSGKPYPPLALAVVHGVFAASALIALIVAVANAAAPSLAKIALVLFLVAAVGGFVLFFKHLQKAELPRGLIIVHALIAIVAFVLLLGARL
jgi:hypothetical protein